MSPLLPIKIKAKFFPTPWKYWKEWSYTEEVKCWPSDESQNSKYSWDDFKQLKQNGKKKKKKVVSKIIK